jgi:beta-N-acetylhexosaminidase
MKRPLLILLICCSFRSFSQTTPSAAALRWVDSVFASLSEDQKIAQLIIVRMSAIDGTTRKVTFYETEVRDAIKKYDVGGICLFQGGPLKQATLINNMQAISRTPLLISIDAENGLGMRMDSVTSLPRQMMMGAVDDPTLIYDYGRLVGEQCKRIGIQVNYAPVVDINNNPDNPVINDRSFGEDKHRVALLGIQYMRGLQDVGVMASAKHFPGHGDVSVDSHVDLPVISKSRQTLDSLELYPFRQIIKAGVGSVMVGHLSIPAIDNTSNTPSSLSYQTITSLLRNELGHTGLIFTDALEMKGVTKAAGPGQVSLKALQAGNDMLCLPPDVPGSIKKIREALKKKMVDTAEFNGHVRRVLLAKYQYGLSNLQPVQLDHLTEDLNARTDEMRRLIAQHSITLLRSNDPSLVPLATGKKIAYIGIGLSGDNAFSKQMRDDYGANVYYFDYDMDDSMVTPMLQLINKRYDAVVIGVHHYGRTPAKGYGISKAAITLVSEIEKAHKTVTFVFGNAYGLKNFCDSKNLVACYEDDPITQQVAVNMLEGKFVPKGKLPVTVCGTLKFGDGIVTSRLLHDARPADIGLRASDLSSIDSIVNDAIHRRAIPGAVVLVARDGKIGYERAFGYLGYDSTEPVYPETIYDLASCTKIMATTMAVMKLYDEGRLKLNTTLGSYLPWVRGSNKEKLLIWDILLHQAGLKAFIPFYKETIDTLRADRPSYNIYASERDTSYPVRVADKMYLRRDWSDTIQKRILQSAVNPPGNYLYSDMDFIFLGRIVETLTKMPLDEYVRKTFYEPLKMYSAGFKPRDHFILSQVAPTETETGFRHQQLRGDVHDPGAAMMGGVAGHAGLFSDAYDLAVLCQMLLNGGQMNGIRFLKKQTIDLFTAYHGSSRRGLGFDKPEKDNGTRADPYPCLSASPATFGHTGFTGTCVWVDPAYRLIFVFLSNRVYNNGDPGRFGRMNIRPKVQEVPYRAMSNSPSKFLLTKTFTRNLY